MGKSGFDDFVDLCQRAFLCFRQHASLLLAVLLLVRRKIASVEGGLDLVRNWRRVRGRRDGWRLRDHLAKP